MLAKPGSGQDVRVISSVPLAPLPQTYQPAPLLPPASPRKTDSRWAFPPAVHRFVDTYYGSEPPTLSAGGMVTIILKPPLCDFHYAKICVITELSLLCFLVKLAVVASVMFFFLLFFFLSEGTPESLPQSYHTPPLPPQALSPGGPHTHIPMTFPRVPPHVFFGQHILSASKFNRDQVT